MAEYIEREALMAEIHRIGGHNLCEWHTIGVKALVDRQPTADVVARVHGEWIYDEENECYICSVCGKSALNNYRGLSVASNGCPHCLAKMDGKGENK